MALALDGSTPAKAVAGVNTAATTASFTPPAGAELVAEISYNSDNGVGDNRTVTGGGLAWTRQGLKSLDAGSTGGAGTEGGAEVWTAISAGAAMTVTSSAGANSASEQMLKVLVYTGAESVAGGAVAAASAASGLPSVALVTTRGGSWVVAVSSDWAQAGLGTAGSGQTIVDENDIAGQYTAHAWRQTAATPASGTSVTSNLTAPSAQRYNLLAYEVREPAAASSAPPPALPPHLLQLLAARNQAQWAGSPAALGAVDLDGSAAAAAGASADTAVDRPFAATASAAAGAAGSLSVDRPVAGDAVASAAATGSASAARAVAGHADAATDVDGDLVRAAGLTGSSPAAAGASAAADAARPLIGTGLAAADLDGSLSADRPLAAMAAAASGATADLSIQGQVQLTGAAPAAAHAAGELAEARALIALSPAAAELGGALSAARPVTGTAAAAAGARGLLDGGRMLAAVGASAAAAAGALTVSAAPPFAPGRLDVAGLTHPSLTGSPSPDQLAAAGRPHPSLTATAGADQLSVSPGPTATLEVGGP